MIPQFFHRARATRAALFAALIGSALSFGACDKDPVKPPVTVQTHYLAPTSPQNVLQNLVLAYNNRDSVETRVVYDPLYQGTSTDPSQPTPIHYFTYLDEIYHVKWIHDDQNTLTVALDLGPPAVWQRLPGLPSDPPGAAVIPITYFSLTFILTGNQSYATKPVSMEFAFKPTVSAASDTTWTVIRWTEAAQ